jgi:hypothetical protein
MKKFSIIALILLIIPIAVNAQNDGAASTGLSFLKLGAGARALAMGEAFSSVSNDATAFIYNPARLVIGDKGNVSFMHNFSVQDLSTDFIAAKFPSGKKLAFGLGVFTTGVNDIEIRNTPGAVVETFDSRNFSAGLSVAYMVANNVSVGITGKLIYEKIYVDDASGYAFDFGTNYSKDNYSLSFAIANVGSIDDLKNENSKLPSLVRFGGSYKFLPSKTFSILAALDGFQVLSGGSFHLHSGIEAGYKDFLFLRLGYQSGYENKGLTTGLGFRYQAWSIDYAFVPYTDSFGTSNAISLGVNF